MCNCNCGIRRVRSYELEDEDCEPFIRITVSSPTVGNQFLCVKFRSIPQDTESYPIKIVLNEEDTDVVSRSGRTITTADLQEGIILSGVYDKRNNKYTVC